MVMAAYNIYEAKTNLSALVEKAGAGEDVIIARAGKPVARLVPIQEAPRSRVSKVYRRGGQNFAGWDSVPDTIDDPLPDEMQHALGMKD
jgi:prevent-host-death family protein